MPAWDSRRAVSAFGTDDRARPQSATVSHSCANRAPAHRCERLHAAFNFLIRDGSPLVQVHRACQILLLLVAPLPLVESRQPHSETSESRVRKAAIAVSAR